MSPLKEPCFFAAEIRPGSFTPELRPFGEEMVQRTRRWIADGAQGKRFGGIVENESDYRSLFEGVRGEKAIGEGSVCYLWSESAPAAIAGLVPAARVIVVLMDPAERAFRQYLKSLADGNVSHSFCEHLDAVAIAPKEFSPFYPFLEFGDYLEQVQRCKQHFPANQLYISLYDDMVADRAGWFRSVLRFLDVEESFQPQPVSIPSKPKFPAGECPKLREDDRMRLVHFYRDGVLKLQDLLDRDLSMWLR
jgi:hypothetical protein